MRFDRLRIVRMESKAATTSRTPGWVTNTDRRLSMVSADLSTGTTRKLGGRMSGVTDSTICGVFWNRSLNSSKVRSWSKYSKRSIWVESSSWRSTASVWASVASGCMKTMNSMPPCHCWVALSTE